MDFVRSHFGKMQLWKVEHFLHFSEVTSYKIHILTTYLEFQKVYVYIFLACFPEESNFPFNLNTLMSLLDKPSCLTFLTFFYPSYFNCFSIYVSVSIFWATLMSPLRTKHVSVDVSICMLPFSLNSVHLFKSACLFKREFNSTSNWK